MTIEPGFRAAAAERAEASSPAEAALRTAIGSGTSAVANGAPAASAAFAPCDEHARVNCRRCRGGIALTAAGTAPINGTPGASIVARALASARIESGSGRTACRTKRPEGRSAFGSGAAATAAAIAADDAAAEGLAAAPVPPAAAPLALLSTPPAGSFSMSCSGSSASDSRERKASSSSPSPSCSCSSPSSSSSSWSR